MTFSDSKYTSTKINYNLIDIVLFIFIHIDENRLFTCSLLREIMDMFPFCGICSIGSGYKTVPIKRMPGHIV